MLLSSNTFSSEKQKNLKEDKIFSIRQLKENIACIQVKGTGTLFHLSSG